MHGGDLVLGGPLWWISVALFGAAWLLAWFMSFDAGRAARAERFAELPESRWVYIVPSAIFVVLALVAQFAGIALLAMGVVVAAPLVIMLAIIYLLRVVFPGRPHQNGDEQPQDEGSSAPFSD